MYTFLEPEQTRDLLYVKDCAEFVVMAGYNRSVEGEILNAGTAVDITIRKLAEKISEGRVEIKHVEHIHPQSEIMKLKCNYNKANEIMGWFPKHTLKDGLKETEAWLKNRERLSVKV